MLCPMMPLVQTSCCEVSGPSRTASMLPTPTKGQARGGQDDLGHRCDGAPRAAQTLVERPKQRHEFDPLLGFDQIPGLHRGFMGFHAVPQHHRSRPPGRGPVGGKQTTYASPFTL